MLRHGKNSFLWGKPMVPTCQAPADDLPPSFHFTQAFGGHDVTHHLPRSRRTDGWFFTMKRWRSSGQTKGISPSKLGFYQEKMQLWVLRSWSGPSWGNLIIKEGRDCRHKLGEWTRRNMGICMQLLQPRMRFMLPSNFLNFKTLLKKALAGLLLLCNNQCLEYTGHSTKAYEIPWFNSGLPHCGTSPCFTSNTA